MFNFFRVCAPRPTTRPTTRTIYYRVESGRTDYGFSLEPQANGQWRIYITMQPSYGSQPTDCHSTHRLTDGGRQYICWQGAIPSEDAARGVAKLWAEKTERYILRGERF